MNKTLLYPLALMTLLFVACKTSTVVISSSSTEAISIDKKYDPGCDRMENFIAPLRQHMQEQMNVVIGNAPEYMAKGLPESLLSNWAADVTLRAGEQYLGKHVDVGLVNVGGLRCDIKPGDVTIGTIYTLMPFDNTLAIVTLPGTLLEELCQDIAKQGGQGVSGISMTIRDKHAYDITVGGEPLDLDKEYIVSTSNYVAEGNDRLYAIAKGKVEDTGKPLRDIYIDMVKQDGVMASKLDGRIVIK